MKAGTERLDVTSEELAALVEGVREALGEAGYQKLQAAIRTLGYVTELLPVSGVNFLGFAQKWPKIEDSSQSYCSSRSILEDATSVPQWF